MNFGEILLALIGGALATIEQSKILPLLQDLHDSNLADYTAAVTGLHAGLKHLAPLAAKSSTKIDDLIIAGLNDAVNASAAANGITFED